MSTNSWRQNMDHKLGLGADALSDRKRRILKHVEDRTFVSRDVSHELKSKQTFGEWLADKVAEFGGSWTFISLFGSFLVVWALINTLILISNPFDPFPFIFLNLMLSMLAAVQAPIILMSQNRQSAKDRIASQHDYEVNLKAELEIMSLHDKIDQLRNEQWMTMLAKQDEHFKLLSELLKSKA